MTILEEFCSAVLQCIQSKCTQDAQSCNNSCSFLTAAFDSKQLLWSWSVNKGFSVDAPTGNCKQCSTTHCSGRLQSLTFRAAVWSRRYPQIYQNRVVLPRECLGLFLWQLLAPPSGYNLRRSCTEKLTQSNTALNGQRKGCKICE